MNNYNFRYKINYIFNPIDSFIHLDCDSYMIDHDIETLAYKIDYYKQKCKEIPKFLPPHFELLKRELHELKKKLKIQTHIGSLLI